MDRSGAYVNGCVWWCSAIMPIPSFLFGAVLSHISQHKTWTTSHIFNSGSLTPPLATNHSPGLVRHKHQPKVSTLLTISYTEASESEFSTSAAAWANLLVQQQTALHSQYIWGYFSPSSFQEPIATAATCWLGMVQETSWQSSHCPGSTCSTVPAVHREDPGWQCFSPHVFVVRRPLCFLIVSGQFSVGHALCYTPKGLFWWFFSCRGSSGPPQWWCIL